ncbi:unnamed protein product [Cyprideis torosa]|uniref:Uncharacterized protein n=1 Tax=Cyprideis torosa TaxID=163714 RepID=A0A7R8W5S5_9CRUS|nr:unnamed protein product [Cyprideis torosa]CAG0885635.1 unnamed protein product [Cyprideis torosa]
MSPETSFSNWHLSVISSTRPSYGCISCLRADDESFHDHPLPYGFCRRLSPSRSSSVDSLYRIMESPSPPIGENRSGLLTPLRGSPIASANGSPMRNTSHRLHFLLDRSVVENILPMKYLKEFKQRFPQSPNDEVTVAEFKKVLESFLEERGLTPGMPEVEETYIPLPPSSENNIVDDLNCANTLLEKERELDALKAEFRALKVKSEENVQRNEEEIHRLQEALNKALATEHDLRRRIVEMEERQRQGEEELIVKLDTVSQELQQQKMSAARTVDRLEREIEKLKQEKEELERLVAFSAPRNVSYPPPSSEQSSTSGSVHGATLSAADIPESLNSSLSSLLCPAAAASDGYPSSCDMIHSPFKDANGNPSLKDELQMIGAEELLNRPPSTTDGESPTYERKRCSSPSSVGRINPESVVASTQTDSEALMEKPSPKKKDRRCVFIRSVFQIMTLSSILLSFLVVGVFSVAFYYVLSRPIFRWDCLRSFNRPGGPI